MLTITCRQKDCEFVFGSPTFIFSKVYHVEYWNKTMVAPGRIPKLYPENKAHPEPDDVSHRRRVTAVCWSQKLGPQSIQAISRRGHPTPGSGFGIQIGPNWELIARYPKIGSQPDLLIFQFPVREFVPNEQKLISTFSNLKH